MVQPHRRGGISEARAGHQWTKESWRYFGTVGAASPHNRPTPSATRHDKLSSNVHLRVHKLVLISWHSIALGSTMYAICKVFSSHDQHAVATLFTLTGHRSQTLSCSIIVSAHQYFSVLRSADMSLIDMLTALAETQKLVTLNLFQLLRGQYLCACVYNIIMKM